MARREDDGRTADTIRPLPSMLAGAAQRVPALTVVLHPDLGRVGEQVRLVSIVARDAASLSRLEPEFTAPGGGEARPLDTPVVSRRPIRIEPAGDGVRVVPDAAGTELRIEGRRIEAPVTYDAAALDDGVVLELAGQVAVLLHRLGPPEPPPPSLGLVGASEALDAVRRDVLQVAELDVPVLLTGESGTGKELVARAIHASSRRHEKRFAEVNMAAVPAPTAASELFGHARGAFTGATGDHPGYFKEADGGTLLLDEIHTASPEVQAMLLRVLETGEIQPVGAKLGARVDVRLVAATDVDLDAEVAAGRFRLPLLHRLAGYHIALPPLSARPGDVARLTVHLLREALEETGETARLEVPAPGRPGILSAELVGRLLRHRFPGNVRELRNVVRQVVAGSRGRPALDFSRIEARLETPAPIATAEPAAPTAARSAPDVDDLGEAEILAALRRNCFRVGAAARDLGIARSTLYVRMDGLDGLRLAKDIPESELRATHNEMGGDLDAMAERLEVSKRGLSRRLRAIGLL